MPRAIWSGSINFGLVSVPVKLYSAISQKDISFHQIDKRSGSRIKYKRVSEKTGREVPYEQIAKGYELDDGEYVVIDPDELKELMPDVTNTVDLQAFVDLEEIDPVYYELTYYLAPGKGGDKAYKLLLDALEDSKKVGLGKVVIRTKQYLAAIRPMGKVLALETMLFPDEVVDPKSIPDLPGRVSVTDREKRMAKQLIDSLSEPFDPKEWQDDYRKRVEKLIAKKAKGETIQVEPVEQGEKVVDLIEALKRSLEESGDGKKTASGSRSARRRKSA